MQYSGACCYNAADCGMKLCGQQDHHNSFIETARKRGEDKVQRPQMPGKHIVGKQWRQQRKEEEKQVERRSAAKGS